MDINEAVRQFSAGKLLDVAEVMEAVTANPRLLNSRSKHSGFSFLDLAISEGNVELVSRLLLAGASPDSFRLPNDIPLVTAIRSGKPARFEVVRLLIQHGANVNTPGLLDASALHAAVSESSEELVELLLQEGADVNIRPDADECTPLWFAVLWEKEEMVRLLLAHGADHRLRNTTISTSPLDEAIRNGNATILSVLLNAGADPNSHGIGREPPLTCAILSGTSNALDIIKLLLQHGADVNASGEHVTPALHAAVMAAPIEIVELLLRNGADVKMRSRLDNSTPIEVASRRGDSAINTLLLMYCSTF